jgi:LCP family protein required for cell wall assembly
VVPAGARSPALAAILSFVLPGLGQAYGGRRRAALVFLVPPILIAALGLYELRHGYRFLIGRLVDPSYCIWVFYIAVGAGLWRLVGVIHAFSICGGWRQRRLPRVVPVALAVAIVVMHTAASSFLWLTYASESSAFSHNSSLIVEATPGPGGETPHSDSRATDPPIGERVTILFTGVDADPSRQEHLYDSIMVVSYDPRARKVQMVSVPRDSASFPLYFGGQVPVTARINALPTYVRNGWVKSPDAPYTTLVKEVSYLVGIPINYYAVMDLGGFVKMIDMVGGIDIDNPSDIDDPSYDWLNAKMRYGFKLSAGPHHLDGANALAYVRSRHGTANNDWRRASRQQEVLVALLRKMTQPDQLLALPGLISTLGSSVSTNFPADRVAGYLQIGDSVPHDAFAQVVLGPPYTLSNVNSKGSAATTCLINARVAELSVQLFGSDSLWYGKAAPANTCPIPSVATAPPAAAESPALAPAAPATEAPASVAP